MSTALPPAFGRRRALVALAGWSGVALVFAAHTWLGYGVDGRPVPFGRALYWSAAEWWTWALLTPAVFVAARRFPLTGSRVAASALALAAIGLLVAVAQIALEAAVDRLATAVASDAAVSVRGWLSHGTAVAGADFTYLLRRKLGFDYFIYGVLVAAAHAADWRALYRSTQLEALRLEAALSRSRLDALQARLQPHFLFNTLNAISALVRADPEAADRMIGHLSDLLRAVLARAGTSEVPLSEELALVDAYLAIERARLGARLRTGLEVDPMARG
ncbi:MAG TPA: histidine kinase, partial [Gemmatimonadaceae bacterium]|nr:histidine kinase [Gemmatimonadaceae bacterium]